MTLQMVEDETGLPVPWLTLLLRTNNDTGPDVNRIVLLYEYLSGSKLKA